MTPTLELNLRSMDEYPHVVVELPTAKKYIPALIKPSSNLQSIPQTSQTSYSMIPRALDGRTQHHAALYKAIYPSSPSVAWP